MIAPVLWLIGIAFVVAAGLVSIQNAATSNQVIAEGREERGKLALTLASTTEREVAQAKLIVTLKDYLRSLVEACQRAPPDAKVPVQTAPPPTDPAALLDPYARMEELLRHPGPRQP